LLVSIFDPENGGSKSLRNVGGIIPGSAALHFFSIEKDLQRKQFIKLLIKQCAAIPLLLEHFGDKYFLEHFVMKVSYPCNKPW
jgi:hypothetical protein